MTDFIELRKMLEDYGLGEAYSYDPKRWGGTTEDAIIDYVKELLEAHKEIVKEELIKKLPKERHNVLSSEREVCRTLGYNQCLEEIKLILNQ